MNKLDRPIVLIGGGGHAGVIADILLSQGETIVAVITPDDLSERAVFRHLMQASKVIHYRQDSDVVNFSPDSIYLVNGIGMMPKSHFRKRLNEMFLAQGYQFASVIADSAKVSSFAQLDDGVQVLTDVIINAGVSIGAHSIINTGALIEHDCCVGEYNHIAPRAILCGQVNTSESVFVGAGATVIQNIDLGHSAVVGAGAIAIKKVYDYQTWYPCRNSINRTMNQE